MAGICAASALALLLLALALVTALPGTTPASSAATEGAPVNPVAQTDDSVPAEGVTMIGATPGEAGAGANETWGIGSSSGGAVLVRYAGRNGNVGESGWSLGPVLQGEEGGPLKGFEPANSHAAGGAGASPLAGQMTPDGAGVLVGSA
jgi:hypothetical protein